MALVVGILLGKHGVEEVTLHEVFGNGLFVEESFPYLLCQFLIAQARVVGSQEQGSSIFKVGQVEAEVTAISCF